MFPLFNAKCQCYTGNVKRINALIVQPLPSYVTRDYRINTTLSPCHFGQAVIPAPSRFSSSSYAAQLTSSFFSSAHDDSTENVMEGFTY